MKLTRLVPVQQIHQAMKFVRSENGHPRYAVRHLEAPSHSESRGDGLELGPKRIDFESVERPLDAHEEQPGLVVLVLIGMDDVRPVCV